MLETCLITGKLRDPSGTLLTNARVTFTLTSREQPGDILILPRPVVAQTDEAGNISVELWPNSAGNAGTAYLVQAATDGGYVQYPAWMAVVPDAETADITDISELVPPSSVNDALAAVLEARAEGDRAQGYADQTGLDRIATGEDRVAAAGSAANALGSAALAEASANRVDLGALDAAVDATAADKADAEAARDATYAGPNAPYPDTAAGIADTANGDRFVVANGDGWQLFENDSGVAVALSPLLPSLSAVADVLAQIGGSELNLHVFRDADGYVTMRQAGDLNFLLPDPQTGEFSSVQETMRAAPKPNEGESAALIFADADDRVLGHIRPDAGLMLAGLDESVQDEILDLRQQVAGAASASRLNTGIMRSMLESERGRVAGQASIYHNAIVKPHGSDSTETQRIPGLVVLSPTTAYLVWQQRLAGYDYIGDAEYQRLVGALVTYTPGVGVAAGSTVVIDAPADEQKVSNHPHLFLNGDGHIVCIYNSNTDGNYRVYRRVSTDGGATWSARTEVVSSLPDSSYIALGSNGTVVRVPDGYANEGRIYIPVYGVSDAGSGLIYSDDDGDTWSVGPILRNGFTIQEPGIALTHEGDILMCLRRADNPGLVHFARLPLGEDEWIDMGLDPKMVTPRIAMSMLQMAEYPGDGMPAIAHVGPAGAVRRAQRIRLSYDCGRSWQWSWKRPDVDDGAGNGAGYTAIRKLSNDLFIVAYETAESASVDSDMGVYVVNTAEVLNNGARL